MNRLAGRLLRVLRVPFCLICSFRNHKTCCGGAEETAIFVKYLLVRNYFSPLKSFRPWKRSGLMPGGPLLFIYTYVVRRTFSVGFIDFIKRKFSVAFYVWSPQREYTLMNSVSSNIYFSLSKMKDGQGRPVW